MIKVLFTIILGLVTSAIYDFLKHGIPVNEDNRKRKYPEGYIRNIRIMFYLNLVLGCALFYYDDPRDADHSMMIAGIVFILLAVNAFATAVEMADELFKQNSDEKP